MGTAPAGETVKPPAEVDVLTDIDRRIETAELTEDIVTTELERTATHLHEFAEDRVQLHEPADEHAVVDWLILDRGAPAEASFIRRRLDDLLKYTRADDRVRIYENDNVSRCRGSAGVTHLADVVFRFRNDIRASRGRDVARRVGARVVDDNYLGIIGDRRIDRVQCGGRYFSSLYAGMTMESFIWKTITRVRTGRGSD